jgi:hypothetical protein
MTGSSNRGVWEGDQSYQILIREVVTIEAHRTILKHFFKKTFSCQPVLLFFQKRTVIDPEAQVDELILER